MSDDEIPTSGGSYTRDRRGQLQRNEEPTEQVIEAPAPAIEPDKDASPTGPSSKPKET